MKAKVDNSGIDEQATLSLYDYLMIARRRLPLILLTAMAVTMIAIVVVRRMPNIYRAETVILVDPQQVPNNYVASTVSSSISDRLSTLQQEVTSPTRLKRLIDSLNLYAEMRKTHSDQEVISSMQSAITVQVVEQGGRGLSAFKVGFSGKNPEEVAEVANKLAEMFISENLKARERQSYGTAEFLDDELKRTKDQLDQEQTALNNTKNKYMQDLPDSKQYHLEALTSLRAQLQASEDRVNQSERQKVYLQSMMATQSPTVDLDTGASTDSVYAPQIQKLEAQLSTQKARYGDKHPDVRRLQAELDDLKTKRNAAAQSGNADAPPVIKESGSSGRKSASNPVLAAQLHKLDEDIAKEKSQQPEMQQQIAFHVGKLEKIPVFEQRISGMMWDYDSLRTHYSDLQGKKLSADMASALEVHEKGERFVPLDRAVVPTQPYSPKRAMVTMAALVAGLALGLVLAVIIEISKNAVHNRNDVIKLLGETPILADIPRINQTGQVAWRRVRLGGAFIATASASLLVGLAISYFTNRL